MSDVSRRLILRSAAGLGLAAAFPSLAFGKSNERFVALRSIHTGESVDLVYWRNGQYLPDAMAAIERQLRDHRTGEVYPIDPRLIDYAVDVREALGSNQRFEVISGYRSPKTNKMLASRSSGVAKRSMHMRGMAIDIRLNGKPLTRVRDTAVGMKRGGVGYYRKSGFLHLDLGRPRNW